MRTLLIALMLTSILIAGCKKESSIPKPEKTSDAASGDNVKTAQDMNPVVTRMNTLIAPLPPIAAESSNRVLVETVFTCENKSRFTARFFPGKMQIDTGGGKMVTLNQEVTASGFSYKSQEYALRGKGRNANLLVLGHKPINCVSSK